MRVSPLVRSFRSLVTRHHSVRPALAQGCRGFVTLVEGTFSNKDRAPLSFPGQFEVKECYENWNHLTIEDQPDLDEKWKHISVEKWRSAVYANQSYFGDLIQDTTEFIRTIAEHIKLSGKRVSFVEVGCGTGEFVRAVTDDFRTVVGVDFNQEFVKYCKHERSSRHMDKSHYLQGDACHLYDMLKTEFPQRPKGGSRGVEFWDDTRIVACVGNTIGIIPDEMRDQVYEEMIEVAGRDGVLVMVYWNAKWFGDACLNFYHANPQLCGPFDGSAVDFANTTLSTPSHYRTHWTSVEEARKVMEKMGMEIISLREKEKGVFVAARRF
jgi:SAM-dependent methyltransferase